MGKKSVMPKKQRGSNFLSAAIVSCFLLMAATLWVACDVTTPESKTSPPIPHKLGDITLKGSTSSAILTPTAVASPEPDSTGTPVAGKNGPDEGVAVSPPPVKKKVPEETAKKPPDTTIGPPKRGEFTIQIGAYIIDENLSHTKEEIISLGYSPYVTEIKQKIKMFCVIVGEPMAEKEAREIVSALAEKGFGARLLPGNGNTVDVAGGIYYYKNDASAAEGKIRALGYTAGVEERTVETILQCLRIGGYPTVDEARKDLTALERNGFSPVILKSDQ
jgi:cell division septation protein DedD